MQIGSSHKGGAVGAKADGGVVGRGGAQDPVCDHHTQRLPGGEDIKVSVGAPHHPLSLSFQGLGHVGQCLSLQDIGPKGHGRTHRLIGGIGHIPLGTQVVVCIAPKVVPGSYRSLGQHRIAGVKVMPQSIGGQSGLPHQKRQTEPRRGKSFIPISHGSSYQ